MAIVAGYNVTNLYVEINGKGGGFLSSFPPPTYEVEEIIEYVLEELAFERK